MILGIPSWLLICLAIIIGTIIIANLVFSIICRFIHFKILKKHHDIAGFIIGAFGVLYSVFLGFTIVSSQQNLNNIILEVNEEAYLSESLFQAANAFPQETKIEIQQKVMTYVKSIINDEWPLMYKKEESPLTLIKLEEMWQAFFQFNPQTEREKLWYSKAIGALLKQSSARLKRVYASWESIGSLIWVGLMSGGMIIIS